MDFKSLISKISSLDDAIETPKAPEQAQPIRLDEDTELRVLAGVTQLTESVIAEKAVSKAQQKFMGMVHATKKGEPAASPEVAKAAKGMTGKEAEKFASTKHKGLPEKVKKEDVEEGQEDLKKVGDTTKTQHGTMTKTASGIKHTRDKYDYDPGSDDKDDKKRKEKARKAAKESVDPEKFKAKFTKMVEAKKAEKKDEKKTKKEKMEEGSKPDFLDLDKDGNKKEPMKKAASDKGGDKKDGEKKGMSAKQAKYFGKKNESVKASKKVVAESVEGKLSFRDMMKLVVESGGQQQIDPLDKDLFAWAERVAKTKIGEGMKAEVYAGMVYERMGGRFEMYDVLSEQQK